MNLLWIVKVFSIYAIGNTIFICPPILGIGQDVEKAPSTMHPHAPLE